MALGTQKITTTDRPLFLRGHGTSLEYPFHLRTECQHEGFESCYPKRGFLLRVCSRGLVFTGSSSGDNKRGYCSIGSPPDPNRFGHAILLEEDSPSTSRLPGNTTTTKETSPHPRHRNERKGVDSVHVRGNLAGAWVFHWALYESPPDRHPREDTLERKAHPPDHFCERILEDPEGLGERSRG